MSGRPVKAVQVGGPLGAYFPRELFDTPFDYEAFAARDGLIGHAGVVVFDETAQMAKQARFAFDFCSVEAAASARPAASARRAARETMDKVMAGVNRAENLRRHRRPLQHDEVRIALRFGRVHPISGYERVDTFP